MENVNERMQVTEGASFYNILFFLARSTNRHYDYLANDVEAIDVYLLYEIHHVVAKRPKKYK